jgi:hypothetical protein
MSVVLKSGDTVELGNEYMVGVHGERIVIMKPPARLSKAQALVLAAYLVALADDNQDFPAVLEGVQNT